MTAKRHAEILLIPNDYPNDSAYHCQNTPQSRIDWIDMLIRKDILMIHSIEFWREIQIELRKKL